MGGKANKKTGGVGSGRHRNLTLKERNIITREASKGTSRNSLTKSLSMSRNAFARSADLEQLYQDGLNKIRDKIAKESINSGDYRDRALLFDRLSILSEPLKMPKITCIEDIQKAMATALTAYGEGKITSNQLNTFTKACTTLSQLYFDQDVQKQLEEIKQQLEDQHKPKENEFA